MGWGFQTSIVLLGWIMVGGILYADTVQIPPYEWVAKPLASAGFVVLAWYRGGWESDYGMWLMMALLFSFAGDIALCFKSRGPFLVGLVFFLLAHLCFIPAFLRYAGGAPISWVVLGIFGMTAGIFIFLYRYLSAKKMVIPVLGYMAVVSVMLACAISVPLQTVGPLEWPQIAIALGGIFFYMSDISVAILAFVEQKVIHRYWGIPMYYLAQYLLATTVS